MVVIKCDKCGGAGEVESFEWYKCPKCEGSGAFVMTEEQKNVLDNIQAEERRKFSEEFDLAQSKLVSHP